MHVLLINQFYPPDPAPTGQLLSHLARALAERGHGVRVICSAQRYGGVSAQGAADFDSASAKPSRIGDVVVTRVAGFGFGRRSKLGRVLDYASFYVVALFHALVTPRPEVVVMLTTPPYIGFIGTVLRFLRGCKFVQWVMDLYPDAMVAHGMLSRNGWLTRVLMLLTRVMLRSADAIWALGPCARRKIAPYLRSRQLDRVLIVPPWGSPSLGPWQGNRNDLRAELGCDGRFVAMYSGNMGLGHDFETFLKGAQQLPDVLFLFVGGGPRAPEVRRSAIQHGLMNLTFRDYVPKERMSESLSTGDVHILSQLPAWQGCIVPSKLAGIFAVGRPAVFVGGEDNEIAHWIREADAGFVVPIGDSTAFVRAVESLQGDCSLRDRLSRNARSFYLRSLSPDVNLPKLVGSIEKLGNGR